MEISTKGGPEMTAFVLTTIKSVSTSTLSQGRHQSIRLRPPYFHTSPNLTANGLVSLPQAQLISNVCMACVGGPSS